MSDERWGKFFLTAEQEGRRRGETGVRDTRGGVLPGRGQQGQQGQHRRAGSRRGPGAGRRGRSRDGAAPPLDSIVPGRVGRHSPAVTRTPSRGKATWRSPFTDADRRPATPSQLLSREVWEQRSWFRGKKGGRERGRGSTRQKVLIRLDRRLCRCWLTAVVSIGCVRARLAVPAWRARVACVCAPVVVWKSDREGPQPRNSAI